MHCNNNTICHQDLEEMANFSSCWGSGKPFEEALGGVRDQVLRQGGVPMHSNSSSVCHQDLEEQAYSSSTGRSGNPDEADGGDADVVQGEDQQQGGVQMHSNKSSSICHQEQSNSSSSENVAAQPLVAEEMSEYEKIRAANVKQKEGLLRQLKRNWQGFKESEKIAIRGSQKKAKKLKVMEKETSHTRSKYWRPGKSLKRDLRASGTGLDNG